MKINILIVDDCPVMRMIIRRTVDLCGFNIDEIVEAGNGKEGLEFMEQYDFDLIISDIYMPVMGGTEMLERVKQNPRTMHIPVLTISAESNQTKVDVISGLSTDFVHKPFSPETLRDKMQQVLNTEKIDAY